MNKIDLYKAVKRTMLTEKFNVEHEKRDFFMECLHGCEKIVDEKCYPNRIFYMKDENLMFEQDLKNEIFYIRYDGIWSVFENKYGMEYNQIRDFIKDRLEEHLKIKNYIIDDVEVIDISGLEEYIKPL